MAVRRALQAVLDNWARERYLSRLEERDPLSVRRLRYAEEKGYTLDELIELEDRGLEELAGIVLTNSVAGESGHESSDTP